jgi:N-acyl-D-aspartate/D-glutamate deacylase
VKRQYEDLEVKPPKRRSPITFHYTNNNFLFAQSWLRLNDQSASPILGSLEVRMPQYDLVVRGGTIADGRGGELYEADIAVADGRIVEIGKLTGSGAEEIDANGLLVTPGFVDIHTHYDGQATWDARLQPSSWHGVTTAVMGNCGVGFAPVRPTDHDRLIELMEGVEDIPGSVMHEGLTWGWESFAEYLDVLASRRLDIDVAAQLPHAALRVYVMGERALRLEPATRDDIAEMRRLTAEAMRAGAVGVTTSRTINHRTLAGAPIPSLRAAEDELTGLAMGVADAGAGVVELISDFDPETRAEEFDMITRVVAASGRPLSFSLMQSHTDPGDWRELLDRMEAARANGLPIKGQVAARPIGGLMSLWSSSNPFSKTPTFKALAGKPKAERLSALKNSAVRTQILDEARQHFPELAARFGDFEGIYVQDKPELDYFPGGEKSVASRARAAGCGPLELIYDHLLSRDGVAFLTIVARNYAGRSLDAVRTMIAHPDTLMGLGDGGAHVGIILDATFPTYLLSYWGRDAVEGRFDLGWLVKRFTLDNAQAVGFSDRGAIVQGLKADLNVIDFDKLSMGAPFMASDLPAGGDRLLQLGTGYAATIVSGQITYQNGEATGALPGRLVRGAAFAG